MVKNTTGGSKTKGQARKFVTGAPKNTLRFSKDELEIYAQVTKNLGNGMCHVICIDGENRLCHIRGKFRGRGKRDNLIEMGTWLLVGLREWEMNSTQKKDKLENCDVLEVYNDYDKQRLRDSVNVDWSIFALTNGEKVKQSADDVEFEDDKTTEYQQLIEEQIANNEKIKVIAMENDDEVDIDDI